MGDIAALILGAEMKGSVSVCSVVALGCPDQLLTATESVSSNFFVKC